jgi:hypothetical protein
LNAALASKPSPLLLLAVRLNVLLGRVFGVLGGMDVVTVR